MSEPHRVVIVGGGFGGLTAARSLPRRVQVTLVDRRNHHLFQPLLYQVATGGLSPANIAAPLRHLLKGRGQTRVYCAEATGFDLDGRRLLLADGELPYDSLIVATGSETSYFGRQDWQRQAPGLKTLEDATRIRRRVLLAFEEAERVIDPDRRRALLTFVVVGAGPTGVELAGALAEVSRKTLAGEFRHFDPASARVLLVEGADRVLPAFHPKLSAKAHRSLEALGVTVRTACLVEHMAEGELELKGKDGGREVLAAVNILWAAGVVGSPLGRQLAAAAGAELDRGGRILVEPDCSLPGRPEVFVIGDLAHCVQDGAPLPGLAAVAVQQGPYVARRIDRRLRGKGSRPFRYLDKGSMATIGRSRAVAEVAGLRFAGLPAWLTWLFVHLLLLAEFQNRILVAIQWGWNYFTMGRSARLITAEPAEPEQSNDSGC